MYANVFTKSVRDRVVAVVIASGVLSLFLFGAMSMYRTLDLSLYTELPEFMRRLFGIPDGAEVASLAFSIMFGFIGAMTLAGLAISMGASSMAGEERDGTIAILLGNPSSRSDVLASKAGSMVVLIAASATAMWGAGVFATSVLDVGTEGVYPGALALHMGVNALFYGAVAMAVGGWTGNRGAASGTAVTVMVVSYVAVGFLPLVGGLEDLVRVLPWYYFDGSAPLMNGVSAGHLGVLGGATLVLGAVGFIGVNRRDLRGRETGVGLFDRLRAHPLTGKLVERLAGSARVSRIWVKATSDHQIVTSIAAAVILYFGVLLGPMYNAIDDQLLTFGDRLPDALLALLGLGDIATPEGWYRIEHFGLMVPVAITVPAVVIAARGLAGEEERGTMGLLLANPVPRSRVVLEKAMAMTVAASVVGVATFAGTVAGSVISGLGISVAHIAAVSLLATLLGLVLGGVALALSAATGRSQVAVFATIGIAAAAHLSNALLPLSPSLAGYARWSPVHYYMGADPLETGITWSHAGVLAALAVALVALAVPLFARRDLRG